MFIIGYLFDYLFLINPLYILFLVKLVTKELIGYEAQLLKGYKIYLTNLEKMASALHKKKGDTRIITNVSLF